MSEYAGGCGPAGCGSFSDDVRGGRLDWFAGCDDCDGRDDCDDAVNGVIVAAEAGEEADGVGGSDEAGGGDTGGGNDGRVLCSGTGGLGRLDEDLFEAGGAAGSTVTFGGGTALRVMTGSSGRDGRPFLSSEAPGRRRPWKRSVNAAIDRDFFVCLIRLFYLSGVLVGQ